MVPQCWHVQLLSVYVVVVVCRFSPQGLWDLDCPAVTDRGCLCPVSVCTPGEAVCADKVRV